MKNLFLGINNNNQIILYEHKNNVTHNKLKIMLSSVIFYIHFTFSIFSYKKLMDHL